MTPLEREIARRACTGAGQMQIARDLGIHRHTVQRALQRPNVRAHLAVLNDAIDKELVRSIVYSPWVEFLAEVGRGKRPRKLGL
jgi:hypothetical protein